VLALASLRERRAVLALLVLYGVCSAYVAAHPHDFENPTVPDERSYYGWAVLYREGRVAVPIEEWFEVRLGLDVYGNATSVATLNVTTSRPAPDGPLTVRASLDGSPASSARVQVRSPPKFAATGFTDATGVAAFPSAPPGTLQVEVAYERFPAGAPPIRLHASGRWSPPDGAPYGFTVTVESATPSPAGGSLVLRVEDSFASPVPGARVTVGAAPAPVQEVGVTDDAGRVAVTLPAPGSVHVGIDREGARDGIPIASVVQVDGRYVVVSRWPAGYSYLLAGLLASGLAGGVTILLSGVAAASTYALGRRLFGWRVASLAAALVLTCGIALMMVFSKGMADYASMAFAVLSVALFAEAALGGGPRWRRLLFAALAGASLGVAAWMRYSTATVLAVPAAFFVVAWLRAVRSSKGWKAGTREVLRAHAPVALAFLVGLAPVAGALLAYNATYFGDPFGSGYMYGMIRVSADGNNTTAEISGGTFYENFNPGAALGSMATRVGILVSLVPFLVLAPVGMWVGRKRIETILAAAFLLSNLLLYLFVPWVGVGPDLARPMEDMRYFLPSVPPAAILAGLALAEGFRTVPWRKVGVVAIVALLLAAGFAGGALGIGLQIRRLGGGPGGPPPTPPPGPTHAPATVGALAADPLAYNNTLVSVGDLTFVRWLNPATFLANDTTYAFPIAVALVDYPTVPPLGPGDVVEVRGMFRWFDGNRDGVVQPPEMNLGVKYGTADGVDVR
jgi:hypothetical protein